MKHKVILSGLIYKYLRGPIIYIWKRNEQYLYIGKSSEGIYRTFDRRHHAIGATQPNDDDQFEFIICDSKEEAIDLERRLIYSFKPVYNEILFDKSYEEKSLTKIQLNKMCKQCGKDFLTSKSNRRFCTKACFNTYHWNIKKSLKELGLSGMQELKSKVK